jgi:hypothetical protein
MRIKRLCFILLFLPLAAGMAQRDVVIPTGAVITIPLNAQMCADRFFANNPGYGTLTLANASCLCTGAVIIPVEFLSIAANYRNGTVLVLWRTASESNCAGYEVQRSTDQSAWQPVGYVPGHGTTQEEYAYAFEDLPPAPPAQVTTLYYRLKQMDLDGAFGYSPVVNVTIDGAPYSLALHAAYPNPASERITLRFSLPEAVHARMTVYALSGQQMMSFEGADLSGAGEHLLTVNTSSLMAGSYLVELAAGDARLVRQFVVRK